MTTKYIYNKDSNNYLIELLKKNDLINIKVNDLNNVFQSYESNFSLNNIKENNNYFKQYSNLDSVYQILIKYFSNSLYSINKINSDIEIIITITTDFEKINIPLTISKILISQENLVENLGFNINQQNEKINEIVKNNNELQKQNQQIIQEISELKNQNSELKIQINQILYKFNEIEEKFNLIFKEKYNYLEVPRRSKILKSKEEYEIIRNYISNNKKIKLNLIYDAQIDGDSSNNFHSKCDKKSPTLTLIEYSNSERFGAFTKAEWDKSGDCKLDKEAFIYSFNHKEYQKTQGNCGSVYYKTIYCGPSCGPVFGCFGVNDNFLHNTNNHIDTGCGNFYFNNIRLSSSSIGIKNLEVYEVIEY